jgi:Cu(I)/Ag(I) efflux system membrane fusion protein
VVIDNELADATESPNAHVLSSIKTVRGNFTAFPVEITRTGIVTYDARNFSTVSARVAGRLEKVYVRYLYQHVRKGDKIAAIYSPDMTAAQRDLLYLLRTDPGNDVLAEAAKQRLRNLGMTTRQIEQIIASNEPQYTVLLYSPADGIVVQRDAQAPAAPVEQQNTTQTGGMAGSAPTMTAGSSAVTARTNDLLREGTYVTAGQPLFDIVNFSSLLLEINVPATAAGNIRKGDALHVVAGNTKLTATVDLIQPFAQAGDQFIKVRSYVRESSALSVGQLITATLRLPPTEGLWLPTTAVYDLGTRKIAFVRTGRQFTPTEVMTGIATADQVMVISGVASGDEVATHAQFLVDHEGFIKTP